MRHRELDISKYSGVTVHNNVYTFPLWNTSGVLVGYQQYRPDADKSRKENPRDMRYFTYMSERGTNTAWGLEVFDPKAKYCFLVEGIFDAVKLHNAGFNALAVLSNNPTTLKSWLHSWNMEMIAVCDGDEAGKRLAKLGHRSVQLPQGMDVGDMSAECVESFFTEVLNERKTT